MLDNLENDQDAKRRELYGDAKLGDRRPGRVNHRQHTMGRENFLKYIGMDSYSGNTTDFVLTTKKFSKEQSALIIQAFTETLTIKVVGAYRTDETFIASQNGYTVLSDTISRNDRKHLFNKWRPTMFVAERQLGGIVEKAIWLVVFPSTQYVEQYAELLLAVLTEFAIYGKPEDQHAAIQEAVRNRISVTHFDRIASGIGNWTELRSFAARHVRLGEIVTIGNVDVFEAGLKQLNFLPETKEWLYGGLNNMFGIKVLISPLNRARIVLLGIEECFWGDAIARYVQVLLDVGARHVLYGSKAATLIGDTFIYKVIAPSSFVTVKRGLGPGGELPEENQLTDEVAVPNLLRSMAAGFGISYCGLAVTVPTVMGEDYHEYESFDMLRPTCMDCENGHIAAIVNAYNDRDDSLHTMLHSHFARNAKFVPVHFVTDYILSASDTPKGDRPSLASDSKSEEHLIRKFQGYSKIGQYFGAYANVFGLRHDFEVPQNIHPSTYNDDDFIKEIKKNRLLVEAGASRDAIAALLSAGGRHSVTKNHALAIAVICQKYGFISSAFSALKLIDASATDAEDKRLTARARVVRLKLFMQMGIFDNAGAVAETLGNDLDLLKSIGQLGAVYRRIAILSAWAGQSDAFSKAIDLAEGIAAGGATDEEKEQEHAKNSLFQEVGLYALEAFKTPTDYVEGAMRLSVIRSRFFINNRGKAGWSQLGTIKGAVAALLLETAVALSLAGRRSRHARWLLALVHILGRRLGGNECGETFGEISHLTKNRHLRDLLQLSLRQDDAGRRAFGEWSEHADIELSTLTERCMTFLHMDDDEKEPELRRIIESFRSAS